MTWVDISSTYQMLSNVKTFPIFLITQSSKILWHSWKLFRPTFSPQLDWKYLEFNVVSRGNVEMSIKQENYLNKKCLTLRTLCNTTSSCLRWNDLDQHSRESLISQSVTFMCPNDANSKSLPQSSYSHFIARDGNHTPNRIQR